MGWLQQNSPFLVAFVASVVALYYYWGFDGVVRAGLVVVGLGLVIFIHELGHFLAAKWCNVHVQTFSLGFGPALPGCSFKWGETTYKVGILPLGGYVQMVGEGADADEDESYPRSYKNKTVLQRMLIISAGVVMNVLLGFVCFAVVYQFHGVEMPVAAVGATEAGSPAWQAGIPSGAVFLKIGSTTDPNFEDLHASVALTWWDTPVVIEYKCPPDDHVYTVSILPRRGPNDTQPVIGVSPPSKLVLPPKKYLDDYDRPARRGSPADVARAMDLRPGDVVTASSDPDQPHDAITDLKHDAEKKTFDAAELCRRMSRMGDREMVLRVRRAATPEATVELRVPFKGFEPDDIIAGTTDPDHADDPFNVTTLAPTPGGVKGRDYDYYDFQRRMKLLAGRPAVVRVLRETQGVNGEGVTSKMAEVLVPPAFHLTFGLKMKMGDAAAVRPPASDKVKEGDVILAARVTGGSKTAQAVSEIRAAGLLASPAQGLTLPASAFIPDGGEVSLLGLPFDQIRKTAQALSEVRAAGLLASPAQGLTLPASAFVPDGGEVPPLNLPLDPVRLPYEPRKGGRAPRAHRSERGPRRPDGQPLGRTQRTKARDADGELGRPLALRPGAGVQPGVADGDPGAGDRLPRREHRRRGPAGLARRQGRTPAQRPDRGDLLQTDREGRPRQVGLLAQDGGQARQGRRHRRGI